MEDAGPRFQSDGRISDHYAWSRTQFALQRTHMAAIRTGVSLIAFGFVVAEFFQKIREAPGSIGLNAPRDLGLLLIGGGVIVVLAFTWQYHLATRYMWSGENRPLAGMSDHRLRSPSYLAAAVVLLIGMAAFAAVMARY